MDKSIRSLSASATLLAAATLPLLAGGLFVMLGNPDASPEARSHNAVLTLKLAGCHEPEKASLSGSAISVIDGKRQTLPLKLIPLSEPGMYAVTHQWPEQGRWVLQFVATDHGRVTSTLVTAGPGGIDRQGAKMAMRQPAEEDIAALLAEGRMSAVARK
jgi:hypothetical protein